MCADVNAKRQGKAPGPSTNSLDKGRHLAVFPAAGFVAQAIPHSLCPSNRSILQTPQPTQKHDVEHRNIPKPTRFPCDTPDPANHPFQRRHLAELRLPGRFKKWSDSVGGTSLKFAVWGRIELAGLADLEEGEDVVEAQTQASTSRSWHAGLSPEARASVCILIWF